MHLPAAQLARCHSQWFGPGIIIANGRYYVRKRRRRRKRSEGLRAIEIS
jgi:hypothetical protein